MNKLTLKIRLILVVLITFLIASFIATIISLHQTRGSLKEFFDTQLFYFAKSISLLDKESFKKSQVETLLPKNKSKSFKKHMDIDDDILTFAIFDLDGKMIFSDGEDSKNFIFDHRLQKNKYKTFVSKTNKYKIVWTLSDDKSFIVAAGQEFEYVNDIIFDILEDMLIPWLIILPILIVIIIFLISKELEPLKTLTFTLQKKNPDESSFIDENPYPKELKPFIKALNSLFLKIKEMIEKERRFTSNAAHELKTPLASIKIQTEVAKLSLDNKDVLSHTLDNIIKGVDRSTRLIEQLLSLSRIENIKNLKKTDVNIVEVINSVINELDFIAKEKNININFLHAKNEKTLKVEPTLFSLLVRNLIDNAIKYNKNNTQIDIVLKENILEIVDNGKGISEEFLKHIGERFTRPAGEKEKGSGLGLSIVKQIALLHNLHVSFKNNKPSGFKITIKWQI